MKIVNEESQIALVLKGKGDKVQVALIPNPIPFGSVYEKFIERGGLIEYFP